MFDPFCIPIEQIILFPRKTKETFGTTRYTSLAEYSVYQIVTILNVSSNKYKTNLLRELIYK